MSLELSFKRRKLAKRNFSGKYSLANKPQPKRVRKDVYNIFGKSKLLILRLKMHGRKRSSGFLSFWATK